MRLIDADELKNSIKGAWLTGGVKAHVNRLIDSAPAIITARTTTEGFPIIDMSPRNTGEWIDTGEMEEYWAEEYQCSICGAKHHRRRFCPYCGADMRGGRE